jgi:hypothetical protein
MSRPSRDERLAQAAEVLKEEIAAKKRALAVNASAQKAEQRKARDRRRYQCGTLVDEAGLARLDDTVLRPLLGLLASVAAVPNPVALLEALLADVGGKADSHNPCVSP